MPRNQVKAVNEMYCSSAIVSVQLPPDYLHWVRGRKELLYVGFCVFFKKK